MFWILFTVALLLPVAMLLLGLRWRKQPPSRDFAFAYRTELSAQNDETWRFAHRYVGKLWLRGGVILLVVTVAALLVFRETYMSVLLWLVAGQGAVFAFTLLPAEGALRQRFDETGAPHCQLDAPGAASVTQETLPVEETASSED